VEGKPVEPSLFASNWGGTSIKYHLDDAEAIIAHDLPADFYWIDAEWFGTGKWHQTAGDWRIKKELYPEGLKPLSDVLHAAGRKLLLWFEPERVCEGTPWYTEHADWLLDVPKEKRHYNWGTSQAEPDWVTWESLRNQIKEDDRLFNFGNAEALAFLTDYMSARIDEFGLDCFRHDANIAPLEFWRAADAPDRQGITEIRWVEGLYAFWDGLLQRHPKLIIDNCASGGRRIDIESLRRTTPLWRTDHPQDIAGRQCHTYGISFWIPLNATGCSGRDEAYSLRSTYSSIMDVGLFSHGDVAQPKPIPADYPFDKVKAALQEYRDAQKYFLGDYYPISQYSQASDAWMAWQFDRPDLGEGLVQAFRRPDSLCESACLPLRGLDPEARYTVANRDVPETSVHTGKELIDKGLIVTSTQRPAALVLTYRREN
jgi:alpha-galactosidase